MKINILLLYFLVNISICYYSLQLNKVYLQNISTDININNSSTSMKLNPLTGNPNIKYQLFKDSCLIPSKSLLQNNITIKKFMSISSLNFKAVENDASGFLNSDAIDGILGLSYSNSAGNKNFINELYNAGYLSSLSFSIIITKSNVNRLYLGDIMNNEYINNHFKYFEDKGE